MTPYTVEPTTITIAWAITGLAACLTLSGVLTLWARPHGKLFWCGGLLAWLWLVPAAWAGLDGVLGRLPGPHQPPDYLALLGAMLAPLGIAALVIGSRYTTRRVFRLGGAVVGAAACLWLGARGMDLNAQLAQPIDRAAAEAKFRDTQFIHGAIAVAPPTDLYNCHDFTFFGGPRSFSDSRAWADELLEQGNYRRVARPKVDDVVVYRDERGVIMHTGRVKGVADELILIESKWGQRGRYLHLPAVAGINAEISYYTNAPEAAGAE